MRERIWLALGLYGALGCGIANRTVSEAGVEAGSGGMPPFAEGGRAGSMPMSAGRAGMGGMLGTAGSPVDEPCGEAANPTPLRALSSWEYRRSVATVAGISMPQELAVEMVAAPPFAVSIDMNVATLELLFAEAEQQGVGATASGLGLLPCVWEAVDDACAAQFVDKIVGRAFRRPLKAAERNRYVDLFKVAGGMEDAGVGIAVVVQAALLSPLFLYKIYWGNGAMGPGMSSALTGFEMASKLSYLLTGAPPDAPLLDAAGRGRLLSDEVVQSVARELMMRPQHPEAARHFHTQWFGLDGLAQVQAPDLTPELRQSMRADAEHFIEHLYQGRPRLPDLLLSHTSFVDELLAQHYGVAGFIPGPGVMKVDRDPATSFGVLTQAGTLTRFSNPTQRGLLVRERLLCGQVPPPPPGIDTNIQVSPDQTRRSAWEQHRSDPACAGCHQLLDPIGYGFESFDELGRYRTTDNGLPIDASGELVQTADIDGPFMGIGELAQRLSDSKLVAECFTKMWWTYANQRPFVEADSCAVQQIHAAFEAADLDINELLLALVGSSRFRSRDAQPLAAIPPPAGPSGSAQTAAERRKLLLDFNVSELQWLLQGAPMDDRFLLDQHLTALRELEIKWTQL